MQYNRMDIWGYYDVYIEQLLGGTLRLTEACKVDCGM